MKKKPPGLYANIQAKRARGEKMRKPGEEGAPSASDFKNAAKTAKKKKGAKRQDPGYKMYDKEGCKTCDGGKKPCKCSKKDMVGRKSGYADGYGKKCDSIAAEFNAVLDTEAREDKPCGASFIPQNAKCSKGAGQAKKPEGKSENSLRKVKEKELEARGNKIFEAQMKRFPKKLTEKNFKEFRDWREKQPDTKQYNEIRGEINRRYKGRQKVGAVLSGLGAAAATVGAGFALAGASSKFEKAMKRRFRR